MSKEWLGKVNITIAGKGVDAWFAHHRSESFFDFQYSYFDGGLRIVGATINVGTTVEFQLINQYEKPLYSSIEVLALATQALKKLPEAELLAEANIVVYLDNDNRYYG